MNYSKKSVNTQKKGNNYGKRERIMKSLCHTTTHPGRNRGWDSTVGIATRYGLDGPGIESW